MKQTLSAEKVIQKITEMLSKSNGNFIEHIASQTIGGTKYLGDSLFEIDTTVALDDKY